MPRTEPDIVIGKIVAPFGIRGEVKVVVLTDFPERFGRGKGVTLKLPDGDRRSVRIENARSLKDGVVLRLQGTDERDAAESLRQVEIVIDQSELGQLEEGAFYVFDLIGLSVVTTDGRDLGQVTEVLQGGANDVYVTSTGVCIPALRDVVERVDVAGGQIVVRPVPGLLPEDQDAD